MTRRQFETIVEWQKKTFPDASPFSKIAHLQEELGEVALEIDIDNNRMRLEFADCFMLLFGAAASSGMSYDDICAAIWDKFAINLKRKWGKPDENGIVKHLKEK